MGPRNAVLSIPFEAKILADPVLHSATPELLDFRTPELLQLLNSCLSESCFSNSRLHGVNDLTYVRNAQCEIDHHGRLIERFPFGVNRHDAVIGLDLKISGRYMRLAGNL
jgi:hypothetical protein